MGLFSSKPVDPEGMWFASLGGKTGKHHGGWLHSDPKDTSTGKHARPITNIRKVKNSGKPKGKK